MLERCLWGIAVLLLAHDVQAGQCGRDSDCGKNQTCKHDDSGGHCFNKFGADFCTRHGPVELCSTVTNASVMIPDGKSDAYPDGAACPSDDACQATGDKVGDNGPWVCKKPPKKLWKSADRNAKLAGPLCFVDANKQLAVKDAPTGNTAADYERLLSTLPRRQQTKWKQSPQAFDPAGFDPSKPPDGAVGNQYTMTDMRKMSAAEIEAEVTSGNLALVKIPTSSFSDTEVWKHMKGVTEKSSSRPAGIEVWKWVVENPTKLPAKWQGKTLAFYGSTFSADDGTLYVLLAKWNATKHAYLAWEQSLAEFDSEHRLYAVVRK